MITLTAAAAEQIKGAARATGAEDLALRIAARRAADGSIDYGMGFDEQREEDAALNITGVDVLIGAPSLTLLAGTVVDYVEYAPGDFRFIFIPPAAEAPAASPTTCGSGGCSRCGGG